MSHPRAKNDADYWIEKLSLSPHPEGGYFNETFAASDIINTDNLARDYKGPRKAYTSIYFLLRSGQISRFHRLKSDELWNYHSGSPVTISIIDPGGNYHEKKLGTDPENFESFQVIIKAGCWFGATIDESDSYSLVGCFVSPGFEFIDFELAEREELIKKYPEHHSIIKKLTSP
ncbi:MAG TPA: cupin domain-containing protein [Proteobacteria bacterium]|nr:cupin domain-containing protein [Pseudomonadota bacterium]